MHAFRSATAPLSVSPLVLAEFDFLITKYAGPSAARTALREIAGTAHIEEIHTSDVMAAADVMERYADLNIGLTDASIVVLAQRRSTTTVLTLDRRRFGTVRPLSDDPAFTFLPE